MSLCMTYKVTFIVKGIPANLAAVRRSQTWFPASALRVCTWVIGLVAPDMSPQLGALAKALPADFAAEWRLSVMGLHMSLQRAIVTELFMADGAPEWLLCCVNPHVGHHVALLVEDFTTHMAAKGFLTGV